MGEKSSARFCFYNKTLEVLMNVCKKGYSIKCIKSTPLGFVQEVLNFNSEWCIAGNHCSFKTLNEARMFFKSSNHALRGSSIWIEGPRRGTHKLFGR